MRTCKRTKRIQLQEHGSIIKWPGAGGRQYNDETDLSLELQQLVHTKKSL